MLLFNSKLQTGKYSFKKWEDKITIRSTMIIAYWGFFSLQNQLFS